MEDKNKNCCCGGTKSDTTKDDAANKYPGAAIEIADDEKVTKDEVKQRTETLGNNPNN